MSLFASFPKDYLEVSQGGEWVVGVLVAFTDPFQDRAKHRVFGHPARNTFSLVTPKCRFLYNDSCCDVVTRYGPFAKMVKKKKAMKITLLGHKEK